MLTLEMWPTRAKATHRLEKADAKLLPTSTERPVIEMCLSCTSSHGHIILLASTILAIEASLTAMALHEALAAFAPFLLLCARVLGVWGHILATRCAATTRRRAPATTRRRARRWAAFANAEVETCALAWRTKCVPQVVAEIRLVLVLSASPRNVLRSLANVAWVVRWAAASHIGSLLLAIGGFDTDRISGC